jgi:cobalt/nickel transport system permease protein
MHLPEGLLSSTVAGREVLLAGCAAAAAGTIVGLYRLDYERIPRAALLSAAFFVASAIQVPIGPTAVHLLLGGLMGLVLGWSAFPAVLVALVLQAVFFAEGGITTLGVNAVTMALPAVACYYLFRVPAASSRRWLVFLAGFSAGVMGVLLAGMLLAVALIMAGREFQLVWQLPLLFHLPLALVEGLITGSVVVLLRTVRPEVFDSAALPLALPEVCDG